MTNKSACNQCSWTGSPSALLTHAKKKHGASKKDIAAEKKFQKKNGIR